MTSITAAILLAVAVLLIGWDVYLYARKGKTISEILRDAAIKYPILAFAFGVLAGHWFWPLCKCVCP